MPSWDSASQKRVLDEDNHHDDVEMGKMKEKAPMLAHQATSPTTGYAEMGSDMPYRQHGAEQGGDLGNPYALNQGLSASSRPMSPAASHHYDSPDDFGRHQGSQGGYAPYTPSVSTKYEPSSVYGGQETGNGISSTVVRCPDPQCSAGRTAAWAIVLGNGDYQSIDLYLLNYLLLCLAF